uniref:Iodothyronine deiodinase n=1 Tax=Salvator merianae TaxID=96440 RepID=A0A8D0DXC4_SALMN
MTCPERGIWIWILFQLCLFTAVGKTCLILFPDATKRYILKQGEKSGIKINPNFCYEYWGPTFFSFQYFLFVLKVKWKRLEDEAFQGCPAPNTPVIDFEGKISHILDFMQGKFGELMKLVEDFSSSSDFLIIYIEEAHASDGWAFKNNIEIKSHQTLQDRIRAVERLLKENPLCPVVLDTMENLSCTKYAAMPERLYVLQNGNVVYKGGFGPWNYSPQEVRKFLEELL